MQPPSPNLQPAAPIPKKTLFWSLFFLAALLYLAYMPWAELRGSDEAVFATIAREMIANRSFLTPTFQGHPAGIFPLYPWLTCLCAGFRDPGVIAVRLPSVLAVFAMALEAYMLARRHRDRTSACLAAGIVLTTFGALRVGCVGQAETIHAALLAGAWFTWHTLGVMERRWRLAWGVALGLLTLDVLCVGLRCVLLFYLPFLFTSMPPRARRLLRAREHLEWLAFYALVLYLWVTLFCPQPLFAWNSLVGPLSGSAVSEGALHHLFFFPIRCFRDMLPWSLFLWVPFCLALRPLEPAGSLCGFLRSTILTLFICHWMLPGYSALLMLPALPALAAMISFTLPIVLHRQERSWRRAQCVLAAVAVPGVLLALYFAIRVATGRTCFPDALLAPWQIRLLGAGMAALLLATAVGVCSHVRRVDGGGIAWGMAGLRMAWIALVVIPGFLVVGNRQRVAEELMNPRGDDGARRTSLLRTAQPQIAPTLYLLSDKDSFPAQMFYTGRNVFRLQKGDALPRDQVVHLVGESQPVFPGWTWEKLAGPVDFHQHGIVEPAAWTPGLHTLFGHADPLECRRIPMAPELFPEFARQYYEALPMYLYRGIYRGDEL